MNETQFDELWLEINRLRERLNQQQEWIESQGKVINYLYKRLEEQPKGLIVSE
jgi:hypothetical protein